MAKATNTKHAPKVHKDLQGFEVRVNAFGEITTSLNIEKLNDFLNRNVDDKKLREVERSEKDKRKRKEALTFTFAFLALAVVVVYFLLPKLSHPFPLLSLLSSPHFP